MPTPAAGGRCRRLQKFGAMRYILRRPRAFWISGINLLGLACSMVGVVMLFYRRRKQEATTHGEEPEQHQENVAVIRAVTSGIDRVVAELQTNRSQTAVLEKGRRCLGTIGALLLAAAAALLTLVVTHCDTRDLISETQHYWTHVRTSGERRARRPCHRGAG
jgi:hypothetical protein